MCFIFFMSPLFLSACFFSCRTFFTDCAVGRGYSLSLFSSLPPKFPLPLEPYRTRTQPAHSVVHFFLYSPWHDRTVLKVNCLRMKACLTLTLGLAFDVASSAAFDDVSLEEATVPGVVAAAAADDDVPTEALGTMTDAGSSRDSDVASFAARLSLTLTGTSPNTLESPRRRDMIQIETKLHTGYRSI